MDEDSIDILMITHNRPVYTERSLRRLLETCDKSTRVWLWHNGTDAATLEVVKSYTNDPRVYRFHHAEENVGLREPTNWLWKNAEGALFGKVDDDCLVPDGWIEAFRSAHEANQNLGAIACWHFLAEEFSSERSKHKIIDLANGSQLLQHAWIGGSGYLMKRKCVEQHGLLQEGIRSTGFWMQLSRAGWLLGWHVPMFVQDHMDDPRSSNSGICNEDDLAASSPLSARNFGAKSVEQWDAQLRRSARLVQEAPADPRYYTRWKCQIRRWLATGLTPLGVKLPFWWT